MSNIFEREIALIGEENFLKLKNAKVAVVGLGGVGSFVCEGLVRAGIGNILLVDSDDIDITNINRQLFALNSSVGKSKAELALTRAKDINPEINAMGVREFIDKNNVYKYITKDITFVADAIDIVSAKLDLIEHCVKNEIEIISSMGTGNKLNTNFAVSDIAKTNYDPLARVLRRELKKRGIEKLTVVYSQEQPLNTVFESNGRHAPASISYVPPVCGFTIAGEIVRRIIGNA